MLKGAGVDSATGPPDPAERPLGRAVLCLADEVLQLQLRHALQSSGFAVVAQLDRGIETLPAVADADPDLVVIDVALVGTVGLRLLGMIKELAPGATVVALSPFATIDVHVLEAGADAVVPIDDLRLLQEAINHGRPEPLRP